MVNSREKVEEVNEMVESPKLETRASRLLLAQYAQVVAGPLDTSIAILCVFVEVRDWKVRTTTLRFRGRFHLQLGTLEPGAISLGVVWSNWVIALTNQGSCICSGWFRPAPSAIFPGSAGSVLSIATKNIVIARDALSRTTSPLETQLNHRLQPR